MSAPTSPTADDDNNTRSLTFFVDAYNRNARWYVVPDARPSELEKKMKPLLKKKKLPTDAFPDNEQEEDDVDDEEEYEEIRNDHVGAEGFALEVEVKDFDTIVTCLLCCHWVTVWKDLDAVSGGLQAAETLPNDALVGEDLVRFSYYFEKRGPGPGDEVEPDFCCLVAVSPLKHTVLRGHLATFTPRYKSSVCSAEAMVPLRHFKTFMDWIHADGDNDGDVGDVVTVAFANAKQAEDYAIWAYRHYASAAPDTWIDVVDTLSFDPANPSSVLYVERASSAKRKATDVEATPTPPPSKLPLMPPLRESAPKRPKRPTITLTIN